MDANDIRAKSHPWIWIAAIWFGFGLVDAIQTVFAMRSEGMHHAWVKLFVTTVISWLPWALATPLVLSLGRRFPPLKLRPFVTWLVHAATCTSIGLIFAAWATYLIGLFNPYAYPSGPGPFLHPWLDKSCNGILSSLVLYAAVLTTGHMLDSKARLALQQTETARLNEQLSKSQLNALRQQIEPHFLFNTLNAIAGLVREKRNDAAVSMIAGLSDFLRRVLEGSTQHQVPLSEELEFTQKYLDIQKVRFAERLQFSVDIPRELYPAQVPSLILQPMVENAVKHGIAKRAQGGTIHIAASHSNDRLTLSVCNDGPNLPPDWEIARSGIGISNVRTRLQSLYGDAFELNLRNQKTGGVEVSVSLPFQMIPSSERVDS
ncbi:sensor histidine kinase [Granulicella sp. S156]|uniref:sensor histidine kinase n=1 Tax=Granulicella sp. S156 TaxID=1747224 RepID=UPI00131C2818|nr:histidine kinase [Granulicella sp. S156]